MSKRLTKRLAALLVVLTMVFALVPMGVIGAEVEGTDYSYDVGYVQEYDYAAEEDAVYVDSGADYLVDIAPFGAAEFVANQVQLINAINNAPTNGDQLVIFITAHFALNQRIEIGANHNIAITSMVPNGVVLSLTAGNSARHFGVRGDLTLASGITLRGHRPVNPQTQEWPFGGGVHVYGDASLVIDGAQIVNNRWHTSGGGVLTSGNAAISLVSGEVSNNLTEHGGGGIAVAGSFNMYGGRIANNRAIRNSGGLSASIHPALAGANIFGGIFEGNISGRVGDTAVFYSTLNSQSLAVHFNWSNIQNDGSIVLSSHQPISQLIAHWPDGTSTTHHRIPDVDLPFPGSSPYGSRTSPNPDGSTTAYLMGDGSRGRVTFPSDAPHDFKIDYVDSTILFYDGGQLIATAPSGSDLIIGKDGTITATVPPTGGTVTATRPGGDIEVYLPDGGTVVITPDQPSNGYTTINVPEEGGTVSVPRPDGDIEIDLPNGGEVIIGQDQPGNGYTTITVPEEGGTVTVPGPGGDVEIDLPGGGTVIIGPDGEIVITTPPNGPGGTITTPDGEEHIIPPGGGAIVRPPNDVTINGPGGNINWGRVSSLDNQRPSLQDVGLLLGFVNSGHSPAFNMPNRPAANWHGLGIENTNLGHVAALLAFVNSDAIVFNP